MTDDDDALALVGIVPDVYLDGGEDWDCPCGGLRLHAWKSSFPTTVTHRCPSCGLIVETRAGEFR